MKLFVGNLPFTVDGPQLQAMFEEAGFTVDSANVITDRETGRSRGFGFVETPDGQAAIDAMAGKDLGGRELTVNEARARTERSGGFGGGGGGGGRDRGGRW